MKRGIPILAWIFLGVLALAAVLITLGKRETEANPRMDSYSPSGLSIFANLLRQDGYTVVRDASPVPRLREGDVAVALYREFAETDISDEDAPPVDKKLEEFVGSGGRAVLFTFDSNFAEATLAMSQPVDAVRTATKTHAQVQARNYENGATMEHLPGTPTSAALWTTASNTQPIASLAKHGSGVVLVASDGYMATNRFIDHAQNAIVLLDMMRTIAPRGSRIVFTEATFHPEDLSLVEILGPGVTAAWYQGLFLFVVVVYTLGKRFGLPEEVRPAQVGQRELVDAVADTYARAKSTKVACGSAYNLADAAVRKCLKLSSDAPIAERDVRLPPELAQQFRRVYEGTVDDLSSHEAFEICAGLREQVKAFIHRPGT